MICVRESHIVTSERMSQERSGLSEGVANRPTTGLPRHSGECEASNIVDGGDRAPTPRSPGAPYQIQGDVQAFVQSLLLNRSDAQHDYGSWLTAQLVFKRRAGKLPKPESTKFFHRRSTRFTRELRPYRNFKRINPRRGNRVS